jgi:hypothetical protein
MVPPQPNSAAMPPACAACFAQQNTGIIKQSRPNVQCPDFLPSRPSWTFAANSLPVLSFLSSEIQRTVHLYPGFRREAVQIDHRRSYDISQDLTWPHECLTDTFQTFDSELCQ